MTRVRDDVEVLAGDDFAGRVPGSPGHAAAAAWVEAAVEATGLLPLPGGWEITHEVVHERDRLMLDEAGDVVPAPQAVTSRQFMGVLPGSDAALADEYVVLIAHYDHLGVDEEGNPFNGAIDDAAGVAALLELARVLVQEGVALPRSLLFLLTDLEEEGLLGSAAWAADPAVPLQDVAMVVSVDPLGRPVLPGWAPLATLGAERCAGHRALWAEVAEATGVELLQVNRSRLAVFGSDQDSFWDRPEPTGAVWLASPGLAWYHQTGDDPVTIDYRTIAAHLRAIAEGVARLASAEDRCEDLGEQDLAAADLRELVGGMDRALDLGVLDPDEESMVRGIRATLQDALDSGEIGTEANAAYLQALLAVLQDLAPSHPGPIPPPFPE